MNQRFQIVQFPNGTHSLKDILIGQEMHSQIGPWEEASEVYAYGSKIAEKLDLKKKLILHDVGMGLASNVLASLESIESKKSTEASIIARTLHIQSFELYPEGLRLSLESISSFPFLAPFKAKLLELLAQEHVQWTLPRSQTNIRWEIKVGDYQNFLDRGTGLLKPDLIFYDFYTPQANPRLWSHDYFQSITRFLDGHLCELYTYSASTSVRLALLLAGFHLKQGRPTSMKSETTIASYPLPHPESSFSMEKFLTKVKNSNCLSQEQKIQALTILGVSTRKV